MTKKHYFYLQDSDHITTNSSIANIRMFTMYLTLGFNVHANCINHI